MGAFYPFPVPVTQQKLRKYWGYKNLTDTNLFTTQIVKSVLLDFTHSVPVTQQEAKENLSLHRTVLYYFAFFF